MTKEEEIKENFFNYKTVKHVLEHMTKYHDDPAYPAFKEFKKKFFKTNTPKNGYIVEDFKDEDLNFLINSHYNPNIKLPLFASVIHVTPTSDGDQLIVIAQKFNEELKDISGMSPNNEYAKLNFDNENKLNSFLSHISIGFGDKYNFKLIDLRKDI